jgi:hypothetical protein
LVTDINVDVGTNGIKTSVKMDLFTPKFGKLKKQHEVLLDSVNRERQKIRDQKNLLIRHHVIQEATSIEYSDIFDQFKFIQNSMNFVDSIDKGDIPVNSMIVSQVRSLVEEAVTIDGEPRVVEQFGSETSLLSPDYISRGMSLLPDRAARDKAFFNSAGGDLGQFFSPSSEEIHPNMTNPNQTFSAQKKEEFYTEQNTGFE